jgi:mRNA interferase MazF
VELMMELNRGDICLVDFNPAKGGEIGKLRPAIIFNSKIQIETLDTIIVIPLSTVIIKESEPYRVFISKRENLKQNSDACIYEIRALSKLRIKVKIASLSDNEMRFIKQSLCLMVNE